MQSIILDLILLRRTKLTSISIAQIQQITEQDMNAVDQLIREKLYSDVVLVRQVGEHIILSGGKRLRPVIALLAARACGYPGRDHIAIAAIVEFIHTATLLHDDVVDESDQRRGDSTANAIWGNAASVLVGDFLYSRAFQMMVDINQMSVMRILSDTTNTIAEGEVMQLMNLGNPDTDEQAYFNVIHDKTAKLFEAAALLGPVIAGSSTSIQHAMAKYGMYLGTAFQLVDDILDYTADAEALGKNLGDDLAEGKPTLPLIRAMEMGTAEQKAFIRSVIENGGTGQLEPVLEIIEQTASLRYTIKKAHEAAQKAQNELSVLPESEEKTALHALADYAVSRTY